jgi:opacity protein-like surface antigen
MQTPSRPLTGPLIGALLFCVGASVAQAQQMPSGGSDPNADPADDSEGFYYWEVTPFVGYRLGGDFEIAGTEADADLDDDRSFGIAITLAIDNYSAYELLYSRQEASFASASPVAPLDLDVEYLHLGGTLLVNDELPVGPYIAGGLGITRLSPQSGGGSNDTRFSLSLGAGVKLPVSRSFSVRLEARGYVTFVDTDTSFFCASGSQGGICAIQSSGDAFIQYELLAGVSFAF